MTMHKTRMSYERRNLLAQLKRARRSLRKLEENNTSLGARFGRLEYLFLKNIKSLPEYHQEMLTRRYERALKKFDIEVEEKAYSVHINNRLHLTVSGGNAGIRTPIDEEPNSLPKKVYRVLLPKEQIPQELNSEIY